MGARSFGRYELQGELARGGMGAVFRAFDPTRGQAVALKLLLAGRVATAAQRERFDREAAALAALSHPRVVRILDRGLQDGVPFLALELIEGESVAARLEREGRLETRLALRIALDVAAALAHTHAQGLLHRDVKPANVLLRAKDGAALLTDYGLTLDTDADQGRITQDGSPLGTPTHWPPEQAAGTLARLGPWSDVFGLGATLFHMLSGRPPHHGESVVDILNAVDRGPPPLASLRPDLDPELTALVDRCLAREPVERFSSVERVASLLREALRREGRSRLRPLALAAGGALVLIVAGALGRGLHLVLRERAASPAAAAATASAAAASPPQGVALALEVRWLSPKPGDEPGFRRAEGRVELRGSDDREGLALRLDGRPIGRPLWRREGDRWVGQFSLILAVSSPGASYRLLAEHPQAQPVSRKLVRPTEVAVAPLVSCGLTPAPAVVRVVAPANVRAASCMFRFRTKPGLGAQVQLRRVGDSEERWEPIPTGELDREVRLSEGFNCFEVSVRLPDGRQETVGHSVMRR